MSTIEELERVYDSRHPKSKAMHDRAKDCFPNGVTHDARFVRPFPIYATRATGTHKWDVDGNEYVDYVMGHGTLLLGYGEERVLAAVREHVENGMHMGTSTELEIEWAELIKRLTPSARGGHVRALSSGTEANFMAIRLARIYTGREKVVLNAGAYHGKSDTTIITSRGPPYGLSNIRGIPKGVIEDVIIIPSNNLEAAEEAFQGGDVACMLFQGNALYTEDYIKGIRKLTNLYGVVLIMDEVVSGMRYAPGGAQEYYGVTPDLTALGKIVGGGAPIGAICGKKEILEGYAFKDDHWNRFVRISVGGTWNAQPITIAGGVALMKIIDKERDIIYPKLYGIGKRLTKSFNDNAEDLGVAAFATGLPPENPTVFSVTFLKEALPTEKMYLWTDGPRTLEDYWTKVAYLAGAQATYVNYLATVNSGIYPFPRGFYVLCTEYSEEDLEKTEVAFDSSLRALKKNGVVGEL